MITVFLYNDIQTFLNSVYTQNLTYNYYMFKFQYKLKLITRYSDIRNHVFYFHNKSKKKHFYHKSATFIIKVSHFYHKSDSILMIKA